MLAVVYSEDMSSWNEIQAEQEAEKAVLQSDILFETHTDADKAAHSVSRVLVGQSPFLCMFWGLIPFLYLYFYQQHDLLTVTVHTVGRNEETRDEDVNSNNSL